MSRWIPLLLLALLSSPALAQERIASLNLCTDLLLLELVERERIVSLTYWAADPDLSYLADQADGIALNHSLAEEIVPLQPDLVLAGQFSDTQVVGILRRLGYPVEVLDVPLTLDGMHEHILEFGRVVGEPERAANLAQQIRSALELSTESIGGTPTEDPRPLAAVYGAQGVSPGKDTLLDDLLQLAGYRNLASEQGIVSYGTLSLEALVRAQPDVIVLDNIASNSDSMAHQALRHPVLQRELHSRPVITLPPKWSVCVGPGVVQALNLLVDGRPG